MHVNVNVALIITPNAVEQAPHLQDEVGRRRRLLPLQSDGGVWLLGSCVPGAIEREVSDQLDVQARVDRLHCISRARMDT